MALLRSSLGRVKYKLNRLRIRAAAIHGRYYCPVCDHRVSRFEPLPPAITDAVKQYGFKYEVAEAETCNAACYTCPFCGATDRDRLYALYLRDYLTEIGDRAGRRLLDFAPSPALSRFIRRSITQVAPHCSYRTADLYRDDVDDQIDIMDMRRYADGAFDFFICSHVLEHVADDRAALLELHRILTPGGRGILVVPIILTIDDIDEDPTVTDPAERWRRFGQDDHVRLYSRQGFLARVRAAGFVVHQLDCAVFGAETFTRYGISGQSVLYVVEKV